MSKDKGASATPKPALVSDQAPAGLDHAGFDPARGRLHAYGHAAYCAGWKAALLCVRNPNKLSDEHSREWIESHPPEMFDMPIQWREAAK